MKPSEQELQSREPHELAQTQREKDLLRELRRRKNEGLLTLSDNEFAQCLVIVRRRPHLKDFPDESLRGIIIGDLV
jgi:hypothetical protein